MGCRVTSPDEIAKIEALCVAAGVSVGEVAKVPSCSPAVAPRELLGHQSDSGRKKGGCSPATFWTIRIPDWHPPSLNKIMSGHWSKGHAIKKAAAAIIALWVSRHGVPKAETKRVVRLHVVLGPGDRTLDPDNHNKALLDGLVRCGALKNDSDKWCRTEPPTFSRGEQRATYITLEESE